MRSPQAIGPGGRIHLLARAYTLRPSLAGTANKIFECGQLLDSDGPARMKLSGTKADFRAHSKLAAIGELG